MQSREIRLRCADGHELQASHFDSGAPARGALVIASALGVPRRIYGAFARALAARGYHVVTFDYRGIGDSRGAVRGTDMRMQDWGALDLQAALAWTREQLHPPCLFLLGHSAGGQLAGLAAGSEGLDGIITVAATAPHPSLYPAASRWWLWLLWRVLVPLLSRNRDYFPSSRVGMGPIDVPAGVAREWAKWASRPGYMFNPAWNVDTARYARLRMPLLSLGFDDDSYASREAIDALLSRYSAAAVERRMIRSAEHGQLGHFGFFREKHRDTLWNELVEWLDQRAAVRAAPREGKTSRMR